VYRTIVDPHQLADLVGRDQLADLSGRDQFADLSGRDDVVILDARFLLDDEEWGRREYAAGHIPGAVYANCATDLSGPVVDGVTGRRPFPDPETFRATLGTWGIGPGTQVIAYDADRGLMAASRLWLMLRWMGHDDVAVLDGGIAAWLAAGYAVDTEVPTPVPTEFRGIVRPELLADVDEVDAIRRDPSYRVLDSRSAEGYHGGGKYYDPVRGHIAGAGLADRADTLDPDGTFRTPEALREHFAAILGDTAPGNAVFYCGSGITAAQNVLAMEIAGLSGSRMYVGSWSEWITDPSREIEL